MNFSLHIQEKRDNPNLHPPAVSEQVPLRAG